MRIPFFSRGPRVYARQLRLISAAPAAWLKKKIRQGLLVKEA
jgi:hypothetical protein